MHRILLVARHEFMHRAQTRSFLFATVGMPLFIVIAMGAVVFIMISIMQPSIGLVDNAGFIDTELLDENDSFLRMETDVSLHTANRGMEALEAGDIDALVILPEDYPSLSPLQIRTADGTLNDETRSEIRALLHNQLSHTFPEPQRTRLLEGWDVTIHSLEGSQSFTRSQTITRIVLPFVIGFFFFLSVMMSSGYLLQAVTEEKENRTMEIMMTSMRPFELIAGKSLGLLSLALTQLIVWLSAAAGVMAVLGTLGVISSGFTIDPRQIFVMALYFLPSFALAAGIMITVGSSVTEMQQGQQIAGIVNLLFIAPWLTSGLAFTNPESPVLLGMTLFPTTSMLTVALRWTSAIIPAWQLALSLIILILSAAASVWIASRVFHTGMLRYGRRLTLQSALRAVVKSSDKSQKAAS